VPFFPEARAIFERRRGRLPLKNNKDVNQYLKIIASEFSLSLADLTTRTAAAPSLSAGVILLVYAVMWWPP
jgi:hypothetical protein